MHRYKIDLWTGYDKLAFVETSFQIWIISNCASVRFAWFLKVLRSSIRMRVERGYNIEPVELALWMGWHNDARSFALRPADDFQRTAVSNDKPTLLNAVRVPGLRLTPCFAELGTDTGERNDIIYLGHVAMVIATFPPLDLQGRQSLSELSD